MNLLSWKYLFFLNVFGRKDSWLFFFFLSESYFLICFYSYLAYWVWLSIERTQFSVLMLVRRRLSSWSTLKLELLLLHFQRRTLTFPRTFSQNIQEPSHFWRRSCWITYFLHFLSARKWRLEKLFVVFEIQRTHGEFFRVYHFWT